MRNKWGIGWVVANDEDIIGWMNRINILVVKWWMNMELSGRENWNPQPRKALLSFVNHACKACVRTMQCFVEFIDIRWTTPGGWLINTYSARSPLRKTFWTSSYRTDHWKERAIASTIWMVGALTMGLKVPK